MVVRNAMMTGEWRAELVWTVGRIWAREGQQAALHVLKTVEDVYGEEECERITLDVIQG